MSFFKNLNVGRKSEIEAIINTWIEESRLSGHAYYEINPDFSVYIHGALCLKNTTFEKLPFKINHVDSIYISNNPNFNTLENLPIGLNGNLSLEILPKLTSLKHLPHSILGTLKLINLENLKCDLPTRIEDESVLDMSDNHPPPDLLVGSEIVYENLPKVSNTFLNEIWRVNLKIKEKLFINYISDYHPKIIHKTF